MYYEKKELKKGITVHKINTNKFKTNLFSAFLAIPLERENVTKNALIAAVLRRGTQNLKSQDEISKKLEEMYGASFDCGIEKTGDNHILKFYLESISEEFLPEKEELSKKCLQILFDIILNPLIENEGFKEEYIESEKRNLKQIIESKIDNKRIYSLERCSEEMFKDSPYGLYKYGYVEDLEKINAKDLYKYYKELISRCKIDIFASGTIENLDIYKIIEENEQIAKLEERTPEIVVNKQKTEKINEKEERIVEEHLNVGQGNLVLGLKVNDDKENGKYIASVYNAILGGGANSKLFQNVREKESLAYTAGSSYKRQKDAIFIRCGIEIDKYEKALNTIKVQLADMKEGKFSEEDINNAKQLINSSIKSISSEQDTEITYYYGQELSEKFVSIDEFMKKIEEVSKDDIQYLANNTFIDTIYFLRN